ncbi:MAG: rhomboid family intramembrane serine protease, partial [Myxococcaceae bacterium]
MESRRPFVTMILVGMNVAVFGAMVLGGISATDPDVDQLLAIGANRGTLVVFQHQWWRTFTNIFIHIGVLH